MCVCEREREGEGEREREVEIRLVFGVSWVEGNFKPMAVSPVGEIFCHYHCLTLFIQTQL